MIRAAYEAGEDALQNLFDITFSFGGAFPVPVLNEYGGFFRLRAQNFTIPASGATTYEVDYKTAKIERVGGKGETPHEFSFDIRVDRNWAIYKALVIWKNAVFGTWDNEIGSDYESSANKTSFRADIAIMPTNGKGIELSTQQLGGLATAWQFIGCFPKTIGDIGFDYSAGDPVIMNVTMATLGLKDFAA